MQGLLKAFSDPVQLTGWVNECIAQLRDSVKDDVDNGRLFAYFTRTRQPEELYCRTLYVLFVADDAELPHTLSGEQPNGFAAIWRKVNEVVFEGRGALEKPLQGLRGEQFTAMDTLNSSAHASFAAIVTCLGLVRNPEYQKKIPMHLEVWNKYCTYLQYMEGMFKAGKAKEHVLAGVRNLHKPASAWIGTPK